jgi:glycosidase
MLTSTFPLLYQINTRVWMTELSRKIGHPATLDDIPDAELDQLAKTGFDWIWLLSVWQTGIAGPIVSRENPQWRKEFQNTLPDLKEEDIVGSGFAITAYQVHEQLGGDAALARLRKRLKERGLKLMLDFMPNHTAIDHEWVDQFPDYYIHGTETQLSKEPGNYIRLQRPAGELILAHGRDPYFPGWPDSLQLNYGNSELQEAMTRELIKVAGQCDGVRCDMAMLVLPEVFEKTWGIPCQPFWPQAIKRVREANLEFCLLAEVYWGLEWTLQQLGFDYTYDKTLYDRLKEGHARPVREHFGADREYQAKSARFLENHDELRAAAEFPDEKHEAAAVITFCSMGLRFFHQGQLEGKMIHISVHLGRGPVEPVNKKLKAFYDKLLVLLHQPVLRKGAWKLLEGNQAWEGNGTHDSYVCFAWESPNEKQLVVVNYAADQSQCYLRLSFNDLEGKQWQLRDWFTGDMFEREGNDLQSKGLYLDEPAWKYYVFSLEQL